MNGEWAWPWVSLHASEPPPVVELASEPPPVVELASEPPLVVLLASGPPPVVEHASEPPPVVEHASEPPLVMGSADGDRIEASCEALDEFATGPPLRWLLLIMLPPSAYSLI